MEYCPEGDLNDYIIDKNPPLDAKVGFMIDIAKGVEFLHKNKIIHRDLKPQNILMAKQEGDIFCKITDFGMSKIQKSDEYMFSTVVGTRLFVAPEMLFLMGRYTYSADVYSLGLINMAVYLRNVTELPERYIMPVMEVEGEDCAINMLHVQHRAIKTALIVGAFGRWAELGRLVDSMLQERPAQRVVLDQDFIARLEAIHRQIHRASTGQQAAPDHHKTCYTSALVSSYRQLEETSSDAACQQQDEAYSSDDLQTMVRKPLARGSTSSIDEGNFTTITISQEEIIRLRRENQDLREFKRTAEAKVNSLEARLASSQQFRKLVTTEFAELTRIVDNSVSASDTGTLMNTEEVQKKLKEIDELLQKMDEAPAGSGERYRPKPPPKPTSTTPVKARALYDYLPRQDDEIQLNEGDLINNVENMDGEWWTGTCREKTGLFPSNYVELLT